MNRNTTTRHRQKGLSSFSWILIVAIFSLLLLTFFKVFPMYFTSYRVSTALEGLALDTSIDTKSKSAIWVALSKRLLIEEVRTIKKEHFKVSRKNSQTTVTIDYDTRVDYISNLYIGGRFVHSVVIAR
jgi:hypothetical protein